MVLAAACAASVAVADSANDPPIAQTLAPTAVTSASAVLRGVVDDAGGHTITYWFEVGTTTAYGTSTQRGPTDKSHLAVQRTVGWLAPGATYHVRLMASNEHGLSPGADLTFTTSGTTDGSPIPTPDAPVALPGDDDTDANPAGASTLAPAAPPALGHSVAVSAGSGTVLVRLPGSSRALTLSDAASVPVGSIVDSRRGSVALKVGLPGKRTQTGTFHGGLFEVRQPAGGQGMTELVRGARCRRAPPAARAPRRPRPSGRRAGCAAATTTGASAREAATASPLSAAPRGTSPTAATAP